MVVFLILHGVLSEVGQATMDLGRHGRVRDVVIDWAGVGVGALLLDHLRVNPRFASRSTRRA